MASEPRKTWARGQSASPHEEGDASDSENDASEKRGVEAPFFGDGGKEQEDQDGLAGDEESGEA
jgi:hypothetical protein